MIISANGIVFDAYGDVLLVQRDDTHTLAPPGGACELNELPPDAAAREVREETGLIVFPVRLVGLYFLATQPDQFLFLDFRCIQRGGEITTSHETPRAGFFRMNAFEGPMLAFHKQQVQRAYHHHGGPPYWGSHEVRAGLRAGNFALNRIVYPLLKLRRSFSGQPDYVPPPQWRVRAMTIIRNDHGELLLQQGAVQDPWTLPVSEASVSSPPWVLAADLVRKSAGVDLPLNNLVGVYPLRDRPEMLFVFTADLQGSAPPPGQPYAWLKAGQLPDKLLSPHRSLLEDARNDGDPIIYRELEVG